MAGGTEEIEQGFIPKQPIVYNVKSHPTRRLEIIQAYLDPDTQYLKRNVAFETHGDDISGATITFSVGDTSLVSVHESDAEKVKALKLAIDRDPNFLKNARIRRQEDKATNTVTYLLTIKGPKVDGAGAEFEYEVADVRGALRLMINYGAQKLIHKKRTVKEGVAIAGRDRTLELDEFLGKNKGKIKLEIEHPSRGYMIPETEWREFAEREVTNDIDYQNRSLAKPDSKVLQILQDELAKLATTLAAGEGAVRSVR